MPRRVFLHVGLPKTGTTFLQAVLSDNKARLAEAGLLFPGAESWRDQVLAVRDVRQMPTKNASLRQEMSGAWDRLVEEIEQWPGDAVVSMEWLSRVQPHHLQRIVDTLGSHEIQVIFTLRDLARVIPASWQESVLNQREWTWREFLAEISDESVPRGERRFWRLHDVVALSSRWTGQIPAERMHVVTVPPPGASPRTLWDRFAGVLGVEDVSVETQEAKRNDGLGLASSELMRRLRVRALETDLPEEVRRNFLTRELAKQGLVARADRSARPTIPPELHGWVEDESEQRIAFLEASGFQVAGDLGDLRPDLSGHTAELREPATEDVLEVALDGMLLMARQRAEAESDLVAVAAEAEESRDRLARRHDRLQRRHAAQVERWRARPMRSALGVYVRRSRLLTRALRRLRGGGSALDSSE